MSTKTYSEQRQAIYFAAARDMCRVAKQVAEDTILDQILTQATLDWASSLVAKILRQANSLEDLGHEQCRASVRSQQALYNVRKDAVDAWSRLHERAAREGLKRGTKVLS